MLSFFKRKPKADDFIAPPPEISPEEDDAKPKFFDEIEEPPKFSAPPEIDEFSALVKQLDDEMAPSKQKVGKKKRISSKNEKAFVKVLPKKVKMHVSAPKNKKSNVKTQISKPKGRKSNLKKQVTLSKNKKSRKNEFEIEGLDEDFDDKNLDFGLPKSLETYQDVNLPDRLEEFNFDSLETYSQKETPKELEEARNEIKSAIDGIKKQENPAFFKRWLSKKQEVNEKLLVKENYGQPIPKMPVDGVSVIRDEIAKAKGCVSGFELESAKNIYIEVMRMYSTLSHEQKSEVYEDIKELYFERKSAERMKS